jgi:hypothetical protein
VSYEVDGADSLQVACPGCCAKVGRRCRSSKTFAAALEDPCLVRQSAILRVVQPIREAEARAKAEAERVRLEVEREERILREQERLRGIPQEDERTSGLDYDELILRGSFEHKHDKASDGIERLWRRKRP